MDEAEVERRVDMANLVSALEENTRTTTEVKNAVLGKNGTPGLVTIVAVHTKQIGWLWKTIGSLSVGIAVAAALVKVLT